MDNFKRGGTVFLRGLSWRDIQSALEMQGQYLQFDDVIQLRRGGTVVEKGAQTSRVKFEGDFLCDENKMLEGPKAASAGYCILSVPNSMLTKGSGKEMEL